MALKPLDIFKFLPKTNCKECGFSTCLAFAMQMAMGKIELSKCPYVSEEGKKQLSQASAPPIKTITIGKDEEKISLGGETVLYRHEKTFYNPTAIGVLISESMSEDEIEQKLKDIKELNYERVGIILKANIVAIKDEGKGKFLDIVKKVSQTGKCIILMSEEISSLKEAVKICKDVKPVIFCANSTNYEKMGNLAKELSSPLVVKGSSLEEVAEIVKKLENTGIEEIIIYPETKKIKECFQNLISIRRSAILNKFRKLGYPVLTIPSEITKDYLKESLYASMFIAKYASIVILSNITGETLFPLLLERLNIFTDPQRPMATPEGVYEIGKVDSNSPLLVTTNFSLTYFIVSGEIENSKIPSYLLVQDAEGLSVLTSWAADKFNAETIATLVKKTKIEEKISHKTLIIPGLVAQIMGELEEELPGWKIVLGPREAAHIPTFLKNWKP